jgi:hypothetical protein
MADQRLTAGLTAWLRDSDIPPPDARMSASRVMAGVETTVRLGRFWPPARLAPAVDPAPALGAFGPEGPPPRPVPRVRTPRLKARVREVVTPMRALAVAVVAALTCSLVLLALSLLPQGSAPEPVAAVLVAPSPSLQPSLAPTPAPSPTPSPTPGPTSAPTPLPTWAPTDRALDWQGEGLRMEADAVRIAIGKRAFSLPAGVPATSSISAERAALEGRWTERGFDQRLRIELETDGREWWFGSIRTYDGRKSPAWIVFGQIEPATRMAVGGTFEGDLRLESTAAERQGLRTPGSATLRIEGLRLTAFGAQTSAPETP